MRVAINGFGRIGRSVLRAIINEGKGINVVAVNDVHGIKDAEYLLKYDSVFGKFNGEISIEDDKLIVNEKKIKVLSERDPEKLPWKKLKVDLVIESTGVFRDRISVSKHLKSGAKKVILTAPMKDNADAVIVPGVNEKRLKKSNKLISLASCTTNAVAPVIKVLHENFKVKKALIMTAHAYTASQGIVDKSDEKAPRRGRAAAVNIVPTSTGAAKAVIDVLPELKGKIDGIAMRVPVANGSIVDITAELEKSFDVEGLNNVLKKSSKKEMKGIIEYSEDELVSTDILGNNHSAIFDSKLTMKIGNMVKVFSWYDNEYGYSCRVVDLIKILKKK